MTLIMPDRVSMASTIGLFILNFSTLDLLVQDYLEDNLPAREFVRFKDRHFQERIERIRNHIQQPEFDPKKRDEFERLSSRLESIRQLRNHIAHGLLRLSLIEGPEKWGITISLPRDLDDSNTPDARHLTLEELLIVSKDLTNLIEDFKRWSSEWVTDLEYSVGRRE
jgi:hypothetical protein